VQKARPPYDVAALNNPFPRPAAAVTSIDSPPAVTTGEPPAAGPLSTAQQQRLDALLGELNSLALELAGAPEALLALLQAGQPEHKPSLAA
jgi:hypothetical protein